MGRLLHTPTVRAREHARAGDHDRYVDALDTLFGITLDEEPVEPAPVSLSPSQNDIDFESADSEVNAEAS
jgi:hypothetical protein